MKVVSHINARASADGVQEYASEKDTSAREGESKKTMEKDWQCIRNVKLWRVRVIMLH
jgi:hypothetical protein